MRATHMQVCDCACTDRGVSPLPSSTSRNRNSSGRATSLSSFLAFLLRSVTLSGGEGWFCNSQRCPSLSRDNTARCTWREQRKTHQRRHEQQHDSQARAATTSTPTGDSSVRGRSRRHCSSWSPPLCARQQPTTSSLFVFN